MAVPSSGELCNRVPRPAVERGLLEGQASRSWKPYTEAGVRIREFSDSTMRPFHPSKPLSSKIFKIPVSQDSKIFRF